MSDSQVHPYSFYSKQSFLQGGNSTDDSSNDARPSSPWDHDADLWSWAVAPGPPNPTPRVSSNDSLWQMLIDTVESRGESDQHEEHPANSWRPSSRSAAGEPSSSRGRMDESNWESSDRGRTMQRSESHPKEYAAFMALFGDAEMVDVAHEPSSSEEDFLQRCRHCGQVAHRANRYCHCGRAFSDRPTFSPSPTRWRPSQDYDYDTASDSDEATSEGSARPNSRASLEIPGLSDFVDFLDLTSRLGLDDEGDECEQVDELKSDEVVKKSFAELQSGVGSDGGGGGGGYEEDDPEEAGGGFEDFEFD